MRRLNVIDRGSAALCDVILLASLLSLGAVFVTRYADMTHHRRRNSRRDFPMTSSSDEESPDESPTPTDSALSHQTVEELLGRIPDVRPAVCRRRQYGQLPVASVVIVFSDYEFYDARTTVASILRHADDLIHVSEMILVDDASTREHVLQDTQNYFRSISRSFPVVRLVRLGVRVGRVRARSLVVDEHVTSDVAVLVNAGVICVAGWLAPLLELISSASDGQTTIAVPHYDHVTHPVRLDYVLTHSDLVATLSWSLTVRMQRVSRQDGLWWPVPVVRGDVLVVRRSFLSSLGGLYDARLEQGTGAGEHVDLSLRTWLCGGNIKVQPHRAIATSF